MLSPSGTLYIRTHQSVSNVEDFKNVNLPLCSDSLIFQSTKLQCTPIFCMRKRVLQYITVHKGRSPLRMVVFLQIGMDKNVSFVIMTLVSLCLPEKFSCLFLSVRKLS